MPKCNVSKSTTLWRQFIFFCSFVSFRSVLSLVVFWNLKCYSMRSTHTIRWNASVAKKKIILNIFLCDDKQGSFLVIPISSLLFYFPFDSFFGRLLTFCFVCFLLLLFVSLWPFFFFRLFFYLFFILFDIHILSSLFVKMSYQLWTVIQFNVLILQTHSSTILYFHRMGWNDWKTLIDSIAVRLSSFQLFVSRLSFFIIFFSRFSFYHHQPLFLQIIILRIERKTTE